MLNRAVRQDVDSRYLRERIDQLRSKLTCEKQKFWLRGRSYKRQYRHGIIFSQSSRLRCLARQLQNWNEAVSLARNGFYVTWTGRRITQGHAERVYCLIETVLKVNKCVRPYSLA